MAVLEFKTKEEFLSAVMSRLMTLKDYNVIVIVETPRGVEVMPSVPSLVWSMGICQAGFAMADERFRSTMGSEQSLQDEDKNANEIKKSLEVLKKEPN